MAFGRLMAVGATVQLTVSVPEPVTGEPETVKSEEGTLRLTFETVPDPGKVWLAANVIFPVESILKSLPLIASVGSVPLGYRVKVGELPAAPWTSVNQPLPLGA